jgi:hypothetical protein
MVSFFMQFIGKIVPPSQTKGSPTMPIIVVVKRKDLATSLTIKLLQIYRASKHAVY